MNKRQFSVLLVSLLALTVAVIVPTKVQAAGLPFSVQTVTPKTQRQTGASYYDVVVPAGKQEQLQADLTNTTDKPVTVGVKANTAQTNSNGQVDYTMAATKTGMPTHRIADYLKGPAKVTIPAKGKVRYTMTLTMPVTPLPGLVAGGIVFSPEQSSGKKQSVGKGFSVKSEFNYVVAVVARNVKQTWEPQLVLGTTRVKQETSRNELVTTVKNTSATFLNQLRLEVHAKNKTTGKTYSRKVSDMQMAPDSQFGFAVPLPDDVAAGKYAVDVMAYYVKDDKGQYTDADGTHYRYRMTDDSTVTLTKQQVRELKQAQRAARGGTPWFVYAIIGAFALLIVVIVTLVIVLLKLKKKR